MSTNVVAMFASQTGCALHNTRIRHILVSSAFFWRTETLRLEASLFYRKHYWTIESPRL
jgi:hypothetical protein